MTPVTLAQSIPVKARQAIYSILATAIGIEAVVDVVPAETERIVLGVIAVLGFGMARFNTPADEV